MQSKDRYVLAKKGSGKGFQRRRRKKRKLVHRVFPCLIDLMIKK